MAAILLLATAGPRREVETGGALPTASFELAQQIVQSRCAMCHATSPLWPGIAAPPQGVVLETADQVRRQAARIRLAAVSSRAMPPGNITRITREEREILAAGLSAAGAFR
jgi:uncharacterized membrane protein